MSLGALNLSAGSVVDRLLDDVAVEALAAKEATGVASESMATVFTEMNCGRITAVITGLNYG